MHRRGQHATTSPTTVEVDMNQQGMNGTNGVKNGSSPHQEAKRPTASRTRRVVKRRKKIRSSGFSAFYGRDREGMIQLVVLGTILLVLVYVTLSRIFEAVSPGRGGGPIDVSEGILQPPQPLTLRGLKKKQHTKLSPIESWWQRNFGFNFGKDTSGPSYYKVPGAMSHIGDKSMAYAVVRKAYDDLHPDNPERSRKAVQTLHKRSYEPTAMKDENDKIPYDIYNCPSVPPEGYPYAWNIMEVLEHWPPDDPTPRPDIHQGLCIFDFEKDFDKAMLYRSLEVPFVTRHDPEVAKAVERWNSPGYMEQMLGEVRHRTEYSPNNHFMYWVPPAKKKKKRKRNDGKPPKQHPFFTVTKPQNWTAPTEMMRMPYQEWLDHANVTDEFLGPEKPHWYYRLIGCGEQGDCDKGSSEYLFDELTFFQPKPSMYVVEPKRQKGIHCRFGMKGVIAENHFDGSRNSIVVMGGERRYILAHPDQCENLALFPNGHPSGRHSAVDWSDPDLDTFPEFANSEANEVILQAGDVLYLPTNWFHYIVSLELNFQCNTRSGVSVDYMEPIRECGF